jgi:hypothetical protein
MIIWKSKEIPETRNQDPSNKIDWPCEAFRRVLEIGWNDGFHFGLVNQYKLRDGGEWCTSHVGNWEVWITSRWAIGPAHFYYDGPHCTFSLGIIHLHYPVKNDRCEKCMPDD